MAICPAISSGVSRTRPSDVSVTKRVRRPAADRVEVAVRFVAEVKAAFCNTEQRVGDGGIVTGEGPREAGLVGDRGVVLQASERNDVVVTGDDDVVDRGVRVGRSEVGDQGSDFPDGVVDNPWVTRLTVEGVERCGKRRREIADGLDLPPYVIFHDATLKQMAEVRPKTEAELLSIHGVGEEKMARYGRAFLEVIAAT